MTREEAKGSLIAIKNKYLANYGEDSIINILIDEYDIQAIDMAIQALEQESKTGYWITHEEQFNALGMAVKGGVRCSECGYTTHNRLHMEIGCPYKFCPNCGARMIEPQGK